MNAAMVKVIMDKLKKVVNCHKLRQCVDRRKSL